jgi:hypothetical protein
MATRATSVGLPAIGLIAVTRVMLGVGIGLLLGERVGANRRKAVGRTLALAGALSTIPLGFLVRERMLHSQGEGKAPQAA